MLIVIELIPVEALCLTLSSLIAENITTIVPASVSTAGRMSSAFSFTVSIAPSEADFPSFLPSFEYLGGKTVVGGSQRLRLEHRVVPFEELLNDVQNRRFTSSGFSIQNQEFLNIT